VLAITGSTLKTYKQGLSIAFSAQSRFSYPNIVALDCVSKTKLSLDHLEFCLPDLGADPAPRVCRLLPLVSRQRVVAKNRECQMRLTQVPEDVVEKHLPAAMTVMLGFIASSCGLWEPEAEWNPEGWPNVRKFKTTSTQTADRYNPPTVLFDGVTYSKEEVALKTVCLPDSVCRIVVDLRSMLKHWRMTTGSQLWPSRYTSPGSSRYSSRID
jgi:hypothetical protein